ncbi:unnamed protein product [Closterium sp. NIES-54]
MGTATPHLRTKLQQPFWSGTPEESSQEATGAAATTTTAILFEEEQAQQAEAETEHRHDSTVSGLQLIGLRTATSTAPRVIEPKNPRQTLTGPHIKEWREAMGAEIKALESRDTCMHVDRAAITGRRIISEKWIFRVKTTADGTIERFKASLYHQVSFVRSQQRAAPHSSFPPTTAPLQTLHMDVWGPARVNGQGCECYFLLVVDDYTRYTTVFPLSSMGEVLDVLIPWIRAVRLQLREREGTLQSFTLLESPQQNGIAERRIGLVMEVAHTSMIHAAAPHFLWPFAVRYAAHQLNLWPSVSLPETSPTLRWTGKVGDASVFRGPAPSGAARGAASGGAASGGAASGGAEPGGVGSEGAGSGGAEPGGAEPGGAEPAGSGGAELRGTTSSGGPAGASPRVSPRPETLSLQQLREWFAQRTRLRSGATGAGNSAAGDTRAGGAGVTAGASGTGGAAAAGPGGARTRGTGAAGTGGVGGSRAGDPTEPGAPGAGGAGAVGAGAEGTGTGGAGDEGAGAGGAGAVDPGAGGAGSIVRPRPYFPASPLLTPSPYTEQTGGLTERREPASRLASPVRTIRRVPRSRAPPDPDTHAMALRPSSVPLRVPLPPPPESSLPAVPDPESNRARAASRTVSRLLVTVVTDPSFEPTVASALVAELVDFAAACRLDYATALVAESESASPPSIGGECALGTDVLEDTQEDFECLAAAVPRFASMLIALEGDPVAPDIPAPRSYAEAITVYGLHQAPQEWHDTLRTTLAAMGFTPTADPLLFLRTATSLPPFYVLVYLGLQITQDRARRTITVTHSHMVHQVLQLFGFQFSSPQPIPLSTGHSLSAPPSDESVEPSGPYPKPVGCLMYLMTCTQPDLA